MKQILIILTLFLLTILNTNGQSTKIVERQYSDISYSNSKDTLVRIYKGEWYEIGVPCGYVNQKGDTVVPIGKYQYCFFDTVTTYAIVADTLEAYAIDQKENRLFEVYWYDNAPDNISDGLFRIRRMAKIGYANTKGEIVIKAQFDCANPFENGKAKVTYTCEFQKDGEYTDMKSDNWFYIDKSGKQIK